MLTATPATTRGGRRCLAADHRARLPHTCPFVICANIDRHSRLKHLLSIGQLDWVVASPAARPSSLVSTATKPGETDLPASF